MSSILRPLYQPRRAAVSPDWMRSALPKPCRTPACPPASAQQPHRPPSSRTGGPSLRDGHLPRQIRRIVKSRHYLDIQRHAADKIDNTGLKWISSNRPQQFRRRHHRDCRIDKSRFIACYNDIRASGKRGTILNLILKVFCEICDCISYGPRSDGNYR